MSVFCYVVCMVIFMWQCSSKPLYVPVCSSNTSLTLNHFKVNCSSDGGDPIFDTNVHLCYNTEPILQLAVKYDMNDNNASSPLTECNDDLWTYDAVEIFIASAFQDPYPVQYIEIEINPNSALYLSLITNVNDACKGIQHDMQSCNDTNSVQQYDAKVYNDRNSWSAEIYFSLEWLANLTSNGTDSNKFQANFFRRDDLPTGGQQNSCYNPTNAGGCGHVPSKFLNFMLQK